jgi:uncharacterized protein YbcI
MQENERAEREISRGVVSIYKEYLGRGPTSARTEVTDHTAITTLSNALTKAERSLILRGESATVREMRRKFQLAMRKDITTLVEETTGRRASAFLSDHDTEKDVAIEVVVFAEAVDGDRDEALGDAEPATA